MVRVTTVPKRGERARVIGVGERIAQDRRSFKVRVEFNRLGRALLRRHRRGVRVTIAAEGTDSIGRTSTRRQRALLRAR